ncbi:glycosyl transferase [Microtetraspora sp. NBRC 13810]|uniref:macrolide family glycosyltransferase n=1 Tax=Microtetraspora sp. NBRC 13810 TaxID=3030990 RepID=UPI0024A3BAD3|nr:macrolide family glycosyltransferase [Microtetraspora sp. NBRC 13810]GLW12785.1 glycosyl transferase [Microtetraspora sp. NBRC 13810]
MATLAFFAPAAAGHVNPTLGLAAELVRRGHRVTYAITKDFAARVAETGAEVVPITSTWESREDMRAPQMHGKELVRASRLLLAETRTMLAQVSQGTRPDLVVHDGTLGWWGRIMARRWQVPSVEIWPNLVSNDHWSMGAKYTTLNPVSPRFLLFAMRMALFLRKEGITDVPGFMRGDGAGLRLVMLPRAFQYAGETFGSGYRFVGPALTERAYQGRWRPSGDLPVVLVSLGTGYNDRPGFYRTVLRAVADRPWQVVLAVGPVDPAELGPIPSNVQVHGHAPQLAVLRHARAFVTHAGMGSTMESLHFGVPMVAVPQMAEQRANADRIAELGLGRVLRPEEVTDSTLWEAVEDVASREHMRERLSWMRGELAAAGGARAAADAVEQLLAGA